ncbi:PREDICTED: tetraspanin-7 isoform X2 [Tarenaya hassleriana]|uniref:tetraspanin-7 isoform X1 n=1 Tax=Tarenaya hassleriana TaxID=28532 RepID=UPI00053CA6BA|nr:PREDICTED: tetraspanin-7 isoform X1 [Tarenaya hassleriana]XP_010536955.1 PREDICTED: tetraspanin-7 isoform X2 [Tarenaya hassleriana]
MFNISNNLLGILNFFTFLLSIPILSVGIWLGKNAATECEGFLDKPILLLGLFLMAVSIAGLFGACCRVSCLLWLYLLAMFVLILIGFCFTIFAFAVTNRGAGQVLSDRGYREYRLGDYSGWLRKRVTDPNNWNRIRSCLIYSNVCSVFHGRYAGDSMDEFYKANLNALQSGCCKPSNDCAFSYVSPTNWTKTPGPYTNEDCDLWDNKADALCYDCQACKAGLLDNIKNSWKKVAQVNIVFLIFLIVVYSIGCCAFRNNRRSSWRRY